MQNIDPLQLQHKQIKLNTNEVLIEKKENQQIKKSIQIQETIDDPLQEKLISNNQLIDVREYLEFPQYHFFKEEHNFQLISKYRRENLIEDVCELERAYYLKEYQVDIGTQLIQENKPKLSKIRSSILDTRRKFEQGDWKIQIQKLFENEYSKNKIKMKLLKMMNSQGIPYDCKKIVWPNIIGNKLRINESLFNIFLQKVSQLNTPLPQIKRDIERTFFHLNQIEEIRLVLKEALSILISCIDLILNIYKE